MDDRLEVTQADIDAAFDLSARWSNFFTADVIEFMKDHRLAGVKEGLEMAAKVAGRIADDSMLVLNEREARIRHEGIAGARASVTAIRAIPVKADDRGRA